VLAIALIIHNIGNIMKLQKLKIFLALVCLSSMAFLLGVPVIPKEKVEQILSANNQNVAAEVIEAADEQS
jgi:hypothetical protein